jgi:hypothetical protein
MYTRSIKLTLALIIFSKKAHCCAALKVTVEQLAASPRPDIILSEKNNLR